MMLAETSTDLSLVAHRAQYIVARREAYVSRWRLPAETADAVAEALSAAGVQFFSVHAPYSRVSRFAVRRDELAKLANGIGQYLGSRGFYYHLGKSPRLVSSHLTPEECSTVTELRIFQYVRCETLNRMHGPADGCAIEIWDQSETRDTLISPFRGSVVQEVPATTPLSLITRERWDGKPEPIYADAKGDASAIEFPVDAVYLWVDDSDPHWRARRDDVRQAMGLPKSPSVTDDTLASFRFRDRGELRASLRSLEMYAPWIRNIYLVTDKQRPSWLSEDQHRVIVVDHTEIFSDPSVLPSYNSHSIGSQIHRIPGLSEHYLLMNDDVLFNKPVTPYHFFTAAGQLKVFFSRSRRPDIPRTLQTPLELARTNSAELLERDYGRRASQLFGHVPVPQRKEVATEIAGRYASEIERTLASPFRADTDVVVNSWLHLYTALFTGRAVPARIRYGYFNIGRAAVRAKMRRSGYVRQFQVICLNDVPPPPGEDEPDPDWLTQWLEKMYPVRSSFEVAE